jgi:hypothetical protein
LLTVFSLFCLAKKWFEFPLLSFARFLLLSSRSLDVFRKIHRVVILFSSFPFAFSLALVLQAKSKSSFNFHGSVPLSHLVPRSHFLLLSFGVSFARVKKIFSQFLLFLFAEISSFIFLHAFSLAR